jgi:site-specific DNA recombinase
MNLALLYIRVSSKEQEKEGYSLDAQEKLGYEYAQRKSLKITRSWKVSESAWKHERTAFNQMVEYAKKHDEVKNIIFDITDRMTRNDFDKLKIYTLIKEFNKTIHFSRTNKVFDKNSGPDDEFMFDIEVAVAKKMSNDISRKTQMGMLEKAEQGLYPGPAPLGYKNNKFTHLIDIDEELAPFVKRAFSLLATGLYSLSMARDKLYEEGLRSKQGVRVGKSAIAQMLRNPMYYGAFRWKGKLYQGSHTPIISKELFDNVQEVLDGKHHPSVQRKNFAFNNLIICGICDCKVIGERKKARYNYYHCTFSKGRHNSIPYIREEKLATMFEEPIRRITLSDDIADWLKDALKENSRNILKLKENRSSGLKTQYDKVNSRLSRLYDSRFDGEIDKDVFSAKETEYKTQLIGLKAQIDSSDGINPNFYEDGCKTLELAKRLYPLYVRASNEEKAKILALVASNYTLLDSTLYPAYRKPFDILAKGLTRPIKLPRQDSNLRQGG